MLKLARRLLEVGDFRVLVDRVEWFEVQMLDTSTSMRAVTKSSDDRSVNHILVLSTRGIASKKHNVVGRERTICMDGSPVDGEFVGGESAGLIRAKNSDTG